MSYFTESRKQLLVHAAFSAADLGLAALVGFVSGPHVTDLAGGGNAVWVAAVALPLLSTLRKFVAKEKKDTAPPAPPAV